MKGKVLSVTMSLLLAGGMLAGCGSSSTDTASTTAAASKEATEASTQAGSSETNSDGKTTITFWHYMSEDKEGKYVKEAVDKFNASQNEIYVEQQYFPRDELMKMRKESATDIEDLTGCSEFDIELPFKTIIIEGLDKLSTHKNDSQHELPL